MIDIYDDYDIVQNWGVMLNFIKQNYLIFLIFILGLILRIYNLAAESIWFDEAFSIMISKFGVVELIENVMGNAHEMNPPLYYILLHIWTMLWGDSEFSLRFLSAILGSLSIFAIYALGKTIFNKNTGLIAAFIIAVSFYHIQISQETRAYTLTVLLSIISFYYLVKLTSRYSRYGTAVYIISTVLMLYTHYYSLFVLFAQNIFCLTLFFRSRKSSEICIKKWVLIQLAVVLAFIPAIQHLLIIRASAQKSIWIIEPTIERIGQYMVSYSGNIYLLVLFVVFAVIAVTGVRKIVSIWGLSHVFKAPEDDVPESLSYGYRIYMLLLWIIIPIIIPVIISVLSTPIFVSRYAISSTVAYYLLVSKGVESLRSKWAIFFVGLLIIGLSIFTLAGYYRNPIKHQWREVISEIEENAGYEDIIAVYPGHENISAKYYKTRDDLQIVPIYGKIPKVTNLGDRSVWLILHAHPANRKVIREGFGSMYNFKAHKNFLRLDLFRLRQK